MLKDFRTKHNLIFKISLLLFSTVFVFYFIPNKTNVHFASFNVGELWKGPDIYLENDLIRKKTAEDIISDSKKQNEQLEYHFKLKIGQIDTCYNKLEKLKEKNSKVYPILIRELNNIYDKGVIQRIEMDRNARIRLVNNNDFKLVGINDVFTIQSAYDTLVSRLESQLPHWDKLIDTETLAALLAVTYYYSENSTSNNEGILVDEVAGFELLGNAGELLVSKNELLDERKIQLLQEYTKQKVASESGLKLSALGDFFTVFFLFSSLFLYLFYYRKPVFGQNKQVFFLFSSIVVITLTAYVFQKNNFPIFYCPFVLLPMLVRVFFDTRTALFTFLIAVLISAKFVGDKYGFIFIELLSGIGLLFSVSSIRKRQDIINAAFLVMLYSTILFVTYQLSEGNYSDLKVMSSYYPFVSAGVLIFMTFPLALATEKIFGFISDFKLLELGDINQPLLRELSQKVPGTFQHSVQVANLAEEAIYFIGGNTLLVRAGALYHDIGKIYNSEFFIENQTTGYSPHRFMKPRESAAIIIGHVIKGIELAREHQLPEQIIDFIRTHHGTTTVRFFLTKEQASPEDKAFNEEDFKYPGPIPFSKETAVLMLADGVEAASRSLKVKDAASISSLVDEVIDYKIRYNQLNHSEITFKDINLIRKIFKKRLMNIYHARLEYPL